jgi:hypothetical protein
MRTTVDLPDELFRAAKARAAQEGESLKELFSLAVAHELGRSSNGRAAERVRLHLVGADPKADRLT